MQMNEQIAMHKSLLSLASGKQQQQNLSHASTRYHTRNPHKIEAQITREANSARLQPKRILRRLPVSPNSLPTRQILIFHIRLLALPLVRILGNNLHTLGSFAVRPADGACDVADGGLESFLENLADWIADDTEETLCCCC
jgi:hypothetical protein